MSAIPQKQIHFTGDLNVIQTPDRGKRIRRKVKFEDADDEKKNQNSYELRGSTYSQPSLFVEQPKLGKKPKKKAKRKASISIGDQTKKQVKVEQDVVSEEEVFVSEPDEVENAKYGQILTHFQVGSNQVYFLINTNEKFIEDIRARQEAVQGNFLLAHYTHALREYKSDVDNYLQENLLRMEELRQFLKNRAF